MMARTAVASPSVATPSTAETTASPAGRLAGASAKMLARCRPRAGGAGHGLTGREAYDVNYDALRDASVFLEGI